MNSYMKRKSMTEQDRALEDDAEITSLQSALAEARHQHYLIDEAVSAYERSEKGAK